MRGTLTTTAQQRAAAASFGLSPQHPLALVGTAVIILYLDRGSKLDMDLAKRFGRTIGAHYPGRAHKALIYPGTLRAHRLRPAA